MSYWKVTNRRPGIFALALLGFLLLDPLVNARGTGASVQQLSWLAGCWEKAGPERLSEEQWMQPRGGTMFGMNRTVKGDVTSQFEFMYIREEGEHLVFTARPSGQAEASFGSIELTPSRVVFENPAHDFPQRVIYELTSDGSLRARIEGSQGGELRGIDFPMKRSSCMPAVPQSRPISAR